MSDARAILQHIATRAMIDYGLEPELSTEAAAEVRRLGEAPVAGLRDLTHLPWSSIDNDESRDLDQLEVVIEEASGVRLLVAIADVDSLVAKGSAVDDHARTNTTSVYTTARIFPMLPEPLSTDRTSLNAGENRPAIVVDMLVSTDGSLGASDVYHAGVRNKAKLAYREVAAWLEGAGPPPAAAASAEIQRQIGIQSDVAVRLRTRRQEMGALDFDRTELKPIMDDGRVKELRAESPNRARDMIESFMSRSTASPLASSRHTAGRQSGASSRRRPGGRAFSTLPRRTGRRCPWSRTRARSSSSSSRVVRPIRQASPTCR